MNNKIKTIKQRYCLQIDYIIDQHYSGKEEEKYQEKKYIPLYKRLRQC